LRATQKKNLKFLF